MDSMLALSESESIIFLHQNAWSVGHLKDRNKEIVIKEIFE